jgi:Fe2+ transport system protein FeoA
MELGMIEGEKIEIVANQTGLWRINILGTNGLTVSRIALRDDEFKRLFIEESECPLLLI